MSPETPFPVLVHPYESPSRISYAYEIQPPSGASTSNVLVFIGGLWNGPHSVEYVRTVAKHLQSNEELGYSVFETHLRSSYSGFGTSSLKNDVEDISALVKYLRSLGKEKIVLLGHSTGCQDCIEYADYSKHGNVPVDGFILQAPVSDREYVGTIFPSYQESLDIAAKMIAEGRQEDCLPRDRVPKALGAAMSAYRMRSLFEKGGDDDYFSSDLADDVVSEFWGRFKKPVLVLHSDEDEYVPIEVDQEVLNKRYQDANPLVSKLSGLIPDTGHAVEEPEAREWLGERVVQFLKTL